MMRLSPREWMSCARDLRQLSLFGDSAVRCSSDGISIDVVKLRQTVLSGLRRGLSEVVRSNVREAEVYKTRVDGRCLEYHQHQYQVASSINSNEDNHTTPTPNIQLHTTANMQYTTLLLATLASSTFAAPVRSLLPSPLPSLSLITRH